MTDPFQPLTVRDIPRLTRYFSARGTRLCNDSAGAAVLWQPYFQDAALELDGTLVLREQFPGLGTVFSTPIGENVGNAYDFLAEYCREVGQPLQFFPATDADVENLRARFGVVEVTPVRAWFDYLYDAQDMVSFRGRRFNGQRNHIHRFQRLYPDWSFERVTAQNLPEVCAFFDDFTRRYHKDSASAQAEEGCVRAFLRDFDAYAPLAGLLRVNGRVVGFSAGEIVGDTLIIHIEKADIAYEGVYQALVNEYAKCFVTPGVRYINREEDAGDEGLRRSKESYHPVRLLEKYLVQIPAQPEKGDKSMQEVYEFLKKCGTYYLAIVDGDQPHVRPFGTVNLFEGNLYIQTGKVKAVSREMTANPKVELCAFDGETWLRVSAKAVEDDRVQARQDLLDHYPELQSLYTADDGNTQVFALTEATATFSSFQAAPRVVRW